MILKIYTRYKSWIDENYDNFKNENDGIGGKL